MNEIEILLKAGKENHLSDEDQKILLPNEKPLGSEKIFDRWFFRDYIKRNPTDARDLIRGLHLSERKYGKDIANKHFNARALEFENSRIGFGSPSVTFDLLKVFAEIDFPAARELEEWIIENGGNYYQPKYRLKTKTEMELDAARLEMEKQQQRIRELEEKVLNEDKAIRQTIRHRKESEQRKMDQQLPVELVLQDILEGKRNIFACGQFLINHKNELHGNGISAKLWNDVLAKFSSRTDRAYRNLIREIKTI